MHFSFSSVVVTAVALATQSSAYAIDVYDSTDCGGTARPVNVYDSSCASWMGGFRSYVPRAYGGIHQYARFYVTGACAGTYWRGGWVDGGDGRYSIGVCYNFGGGGNVANAANSLYNLGVGKEDPEANSTTPVV